MRKLGKTMILTFRLDIDIALHIFFRTHCNFENTFNFAAMFRLGTVITGPRIIIDPIYSTFTESSGRPLSHRPILGKFSLCKFQGMTVLGKTIFLAI